ncbi:MAG: hypothetical protein LAQ30_32665, partial [Acidobacteriia bacterium]|nr:hypothetical protein [Terriglobia bacterium]
LAAVPLAAYAQQITCAAGRCIQIIGGKARVGAQLRVQAHGPVTLETGGPAGVLEYTARVVVRARSEAEARRLFERFAVRVAPEGSWYVLKTSTGLSASLALKAPKLSAAEVFTSDGPVEANGIDGSLAVDSGAGPLKADRVRGDCRLHTTGGDIRVGSVGGRLNATSGAGFITVRSVGGEAVLGTVGGDVTAQDAAGPVRAETGAGTVRVDRAGGAVTAITGGGQIWIGNARGLVTAHNMAGPVHIGSALAVSCNSGAGRVDLGAIFGSIQVTTAMGSIVATLPGGKPSESYLATGNGDITVRIPSNVGVTIQAQNEMADTLRRIVSDFPQILPHMQGTRVVAEGAVNGGGPLVRLSAAIGTIFIKRE